MGWECDADQKEHKCTQTYCGKTESRKLLRRPMRRWQDTMESDFKYTKRGPGVDWSFSGQGQVVCCCENSVELLGSAKYQEIVVLVKNINFRM